MLPKEKRLTRQQFWRVSQEGKTVYGLQFTIKYLPNDPGYSCWAVVTSAKLDKRAVARNRLRRRIYKILEIENWKLKIDAVIFPRPSMLNLSDDQLRTRLNQVVSKISGLAKRA